MNIDLGKLEALLQATSEDEHLEFKRAENSYSFEKMLEYSVALSNEGGGYLVLGVEDELPRRVTGTQAFQNIEKTAQRAFEKLGFRVNFDVLDHSDGRVVVVRIPARPKGTPRQVDGRYLMRVGESLQNMSPDVLKSIFEEGEEDFSSGIALRVATENEVSKLLDTNAYFELREKPYPSEKHEVIRHFVQEGFLARTPDGLAITNLGALLFAKSLKRFPSLQHKGPRFIKYRGNDKLDAQTDFIGRYGYAIAFAKLMDYIIVQIPTNEVIEKDVRKEVPLYPSTAIRELVANALIHQDLSIDGIRVTIELYEDRLEISNPGTPAVSIYRFIDENLSRNEKLAEAMRRMRLCEERGRGIDKVVSDAEKWQLPAPNFRESDHRTISTLYAPKPFRKMTKEDRIRACYQHCVLRYLFHEEMNNASLRDRFGLESIQSERASKIIADTIQAGFIKDPSPGSSKKFKKYVPFWA